MLPTLSISPAALKDLLPALGPFAIASQVYTLPSDTSREHVDKSTSQHNAETQTSFLNASLMCRYTSGVRNKHSYEMASIGKTPDIDSHRLRTGGTDTQEL